MKSDLFWHAYTYFPYERALARREVSSILGVTPQEQENGLSIPDSGIRVKDVARLTYFKGIALGDRIVIPDQARLEASANGNSHRWNAAASGRMPELRRQSTRYSAHGLHEYRGKFNPQIVRAIGNLLRLKEGHWLLDPFCGSGTTLLEAAHIGWNSVGVDVNPLGVMIANAKIRAFKTDPDRLEAEAELLARHLERCDYTAQGREWKDVLPNADYLSKWFTESVLQQLAAIFRDIEKLAAKELRDVFKVILSDVCRTVSLQDPGDLRIRRRKNPSDSYPAITEFVKALRSKVSLIVRARACVSIHQSNQIALIGDSRECADLLSTVLRKAGRRHFDAAICSPPYATALPYIDTQRLSLCLLGLIHSRDLRGVERTLIGNREIGDAHRTRLERSLLLNEPNLPPNVSRFCKSLLEKARSEEHGFRRRNVPALVFKYFWDMARMFEAVYQVMRPGARYAMLVGRNKTTLRAEEITIDTPNLLRPVAESRNWVVEESLGFDTYQRFDVHQSNSIREETLLILRR